ncbi:MAG: TIGR04282 family arsenosugar biosynthesis glycosyltransferase [Saprospiraceae bacterium]|nr:TIGR04282 family arsenosugar biosynthesis glycosyltransferase [Saprospiraceae bacterium]
MMSMWQNQTAIIVFLRVPELGKVKTRLAKTVGPEKALQIYEYLVEKTLIEVQATDLPVFLYFHPHVDEVIVKRFPKFFPRLQSGTDLGLKMYHAFEEVLNSYPKSMIIGTDCPYITKDLLIKASQLLEKNDVVVGPALDGGYYLLGLKNNIREIFEDISWGSDSVLDTTIDVIRKMQISYSLLPRLSDIDYQEDWEIYQQSNFKF